LRFPIVSLVTVVVALSAASAAQAAVTQSSITSPSDPYFGLDQGQTQSVTISGTSNGTTSDQVDVKCYHDDGSTGTVQGTVTSGVAVQADGSFSTSVALQALRVGTGLCRLRAVPAGTSPTSGLSAFAGPRTSIGWLRLFQNGAVPDGFFVREMQLAAGVEYDDFGGCGIVNTYLLDPTVFGQSDAHTYTCNDWPDNPTISDVSRSGILVDNHNAYVAGEAVGINRSATGFPSVTVDSIVQNPSNGDLTVHETDQIVRCHGDALPANSSNCTAFDPSGVVLHRTITQTNEGETVSVDDQYASTDGSSHAVSLLLEQDQDFHSANPNGTDLLYEFPGQSSFAGHGSGDTVTVPASSPATIYIKNSTYPDGSTSGAVGAITYDQTPSGPFVFGTSGALNFDAPNVLTVPAGGSASVGYTYSYGFTLAAVQHDALVAEDRASPVAVAISSPANGATLAATPVTVTGSAAAGSGVRGVTVNGVAATVSGGSYSAAVPLTHGANTLTAIATSNAGATATATGSVAYRPYMPPVIHHQSCPSPTDRLAAATVGPISLGLTRAHVRTLMPHFAVRNGHSDNFCLAGGWGIRVGYPPLGVLTSMPRDRRMDLRNTIVLALTANPFYAFDGVRPGMFVSTAATRLKLGKPLHLGPNWWYVVIGEDSTGLLKARHGRIYEVGIANKLLTNGRAGQNRLLVNF
jgi:Glucodextranase, domain B